MAGCLILALALMVSHWSGLANGRLTEFATDRLPVLVHNLHTANIGLETLAARAALGPGSTFRLGTGQPYMTAKGSQRVRLVQTYEGYEVYGPTTVAEMDTYGHFTGHLYGEVARNLHRDVPRPEACVRDVRTMVDRAVRLERLQPTDPGVDQRDGRRVIYADPNRRLAKIVYVVEFFYQGNHRVTHPVYYMDACSGHVILSFDKVRNVTLPLDPRRPRDLGQPARSDHQQVLRFSSEQGVAGRSSVCDPSAAGVGGNPNTGQRIYNTVPLCLPVEESQGTCTMTGEYAKVVDNERTEEMDRKTAISFTCATGYADPVNGAYGVASDASYFGEMSGLFFKNKYNAKALSWVPRMVVHYGSSYQNAFWTGTDMFFGDGASMFYPLVSLDIVAHELAHGVTTTNSDLIYLGQPGGINEAFSDITGVATHNFVFGVTKWLIGDEIMKSGDEALRYMNDPPKDGKSIKNAWSYIPFMNVHYSSGVFNYAFYQMVENLGMDIFVAFEAFFNANRSLWGKFTRFYKGACNVMMATYDDGADYAAVRKAFAKTWIPMALCRYRKLKTTLFPGESRRDVLVGASRAPIFEVDMAHWPGVAVRVRAADFSRIQVVVGGDPDAADVIVKGDNYVALPANHTRVYVQLRSGHVPDIPVTVDVLG